MPLTPGSRLGPYEIVAHIGAGGMGEVYRARDAKLNRDVAIKVLLPAVANDPDRLARFSREAQVLASLNHPNIAHIHGLEESAGVTALVMELVEGEDLAQRISRGPIPLDEALPIARQIAEALEAAHDHGIIHRDLKPANIKVRPDGTVKVLDFGLAKAIDPTAASSMTAANSPTLSIHATQAGIILGTAAYMSPEQARGKFVDKRTDIWSFGVVLYEMLTGRTVFAGDTLSDTIALVLTREADWSALPPDTPVGVRRLLRRALERDPRRRLRDIGEARLELDPASVEFREVPATPVRPRSSAAGAMLRIAAASAAGAAIAAAVFVAWPAGSAGGDRPETLQFVITPRDGVPFDDEPAVNPVLSPDGRHILMRGRVRGRVAWFGRSMIDASVREIDALSSVTGAPFWSPDSRSIGFLTRDSVARVSSDGTGLITLASISGKTSVQGSGAWSPSGEIVFVLEGAVVAVSEHGGPLRTVLAAEPSALAFVGTSALPDGKHILVQQGSSFGSAPPRVLLVSLDGSKAPTHLVDGRQPAYAAGWLLAVTDSKRLVAWKLNVAQGRVEDSAIAVVESESFSRNAPGRMFSVSQNGVLAVRRADPDAVQTRVVWVDRAGVEGGSLKLNGHCRNPELSPWGDRVALDCFQSNGQARDVWLYDLARDAASRFTVDSADDADPLWSTDGKTIVFASNRLGTVGVFKKAAGGAGEDTLVLRTPRDMPTMAWSPNGEWIALGVNDIGVFDVAKPDLPRPVLSTPFQELEFQFSPDGRWFSYSSDESGRLEVYVQPWPPTGERWQVSIDGGTDARWRPEGGELYYVSPIRELMAVPIDTTPSFRAGSPVRLFQTRIAGPLGAGHRFPYAVARDGKRFLMYVSDQGAVPPALDIIVNWPARLTTERRP
ncbi:MAG: serine/threonine-protein kinase [Cyanobacteria bacterium]|nr:serine/threonine-protein kinase [Cyanobacteriota bacterium]